MTHIFRWFYCLVGAWLLTVAAHAQGVGYGDWQLHLPTSRPLHLADAGDRLYVATESSFFFLNKSENTTQVLSRRDGLNDVGVVGLAYDSVRRQTLVVYRNNNVDIIRPDGSVHNLNDILRKSITGRRDIYQVYVAGNRAYISTYFGLIAVNLDRLEISDTYSNIGPGGTAIRIYATTVSNGLIFTATSVGLLHARLTSNLLDYNSWTVSTPGAQGNVDRYRSVATQGGSVYALVEGGSLHRFNPATSSWEALSGGSTAGLSRLRPSRAGLLILDEANGVRRFSPPMTFTQVISPATAPRPRDVVYAKDGSYYVASFDQGLLRVFPGTMQAPERFVANGPASSKSFSILADSRTNTVAITSGGYSDRYDLLDTPNLGFYEYSGGQWANVNQTVYPSSTDYPNIQQLSRMARTPDGTLYIGSYNNGLLEWKGPGKFKQFTSLTPGSPLLDWFGNGTNTNTDRVTDVAADAEGNVWVVNRHLQVNTSGLYLYKPATAEWVRTPYFNGSNNLDRIALDDNGFVWTSGARKANAGQPLAIYVLDPATGNTRTFTTADGLPHGEIYDMVKDRRGDIWVTTLQGIAVLRNPGGAFDPDANTIFEAPVVRRGEGSGFPVLFNEAVKSIAVDGANRKWLGTDRGLWLFSEDTDEALLHFTTTNSPLPSNRIVDVDVNDRTGEVWVATDAGVVSYRGSATVTEGPPSCTKVSPNPVRPEYQGQVGISGLANNALVKITDISGKLVYSTKATGGTVVWNMTTADGRRVRSGIYLVLSSDADGKNGCVSRVAVLSK